MVGCGRMGSTIDDEHIGMPHYPWPWAHAPAMIEARGIELIGAADVDRAKLDDFAQRWGVDALYEDYRELVAQERPDVVAVTTRPDERAEVVIGLAEAGVRAIFATKPMCRTLAEADAMIAACKASGTIFSIACHLNWYNWYTNARQAIADGAIGRLRSMVCHSPHSLSNLQSHTLALFRLFAGAPAEWVMGEMDDDAQAAADRDLSGSGYIAYANGCARLFELPCRPLGAWVDLGIYRRARDDRLAQCPRAIRAVGGAPRDRRADPAAVSQPVASTLVHGQCD